LWFPPNRSISNAEGKITRAINLKKPWATRPLPDLVREVAEQIVQAYLANNDASALPRNSDVEIFPQNSPISKLHSVSSEKPIEESRQSIRFRYALPERAGANWRSKTAKTIHLSSVSS